MIAFWISLGVLVAALLAGAAFAGLRIFQTVRAVKSLKNALRAELKKIASAGERTTSELEAATRAFERLQASVARLGTARRRIFLLRSVLADAEALLARARAFVPSK